MAQHSEPIREGQRSNGALRRGGDAKAGMLTFRRHHVHGRGFEALAHCWFAGHGVVGDRQGNLCTRTSSSGDRRFDHRAIAIYRA